MHHWNRLLIYHLAYLLAYVQRELLEKEGLNPLKRTSDSLNITIVISGTSQILHSYPYRIRTPLGDYPNSLVRG